MLIKNAFSEEVIGKDLIEVNTCGVTKEVHITLLCLKDEVANLFRP